MYYKIFYYFIFTAILFSTESNQDSAVKLNTSGQRCIKKKLINNMNKLYNKILFVCY